MKLKSNLIVAAAFLAWGVSAHAAVETDTLEVGQAKWTEAGYFEDLRGTGSLSFSKLLVTALNLAQVKMDPVPDGTVQKVTSTTATGVVKYVSANASAPVTSLQYAMDVDLGTLDVLSVQTQGGSLQTTVKNSATNGSGSLSISDLRVDLTTKTIYADIVGANGVGTKNDYALWTFDTISGPTSFNLRDITQQPARWGDMPRIVLSSENTLSGLFLVKASDIDDIFVKALNLNNTGRSGINAVNTRSLTNTAGFGSITSTISVGTVPEPSTYAMMGVGLVGLALFGRRRASR